MEKLKTSSLIYLCQTDTTVGLCSKNKEALNRVKRRDLNQPALLTVADFKSLKDLTRVPKKFRKRVRRSKKSTYIYPKNAFRVVSLDCEYRRVIKKIGALYSTSANITTETFDERWARSVSDIVIEESQGFSDKEPSQIYKIGREKLRRVR